MMQRFFILTACALLASALTACSNDGVLFPTLTEDGIVYEKPPIVLRQPVVPEMLVPCNGHVLVPALGMAFVRRGSEAPETGQYLREERLSPPYRVIPPDVRVSAEQSPKRVNIEVDRFDRITGLFCG